MMLSPLVKYSIGKLMNLVNLLEITDISPQSLISVRIPSAMVLMAGTMHLM